MVPITNEPSVDALLSVGGAAVALFFLMEILLRALKWDGPTKERFAPLLALGLGVLLVEAATIVLVGVTGVALLGGFLTGLFAAASSIGIHDVTSSTTGLT